MHFTQILIIAHWPPMERQNMSGGAPLTHEVYFTNRTHPCLYRPVHFFLVGDIALRIYKCFGTLGEGAVLHFEEEPPYFITGTRARTIEMSGPPFFATNCPQQRNSLPSNGLELKWKRLLQR